MLRKLLGSALGTTRQLSKKLHSHAPTSSPFLHTSSISSTLARRRANTFHPVHSFPPSPTTTAGTAAAAAAAAPRYFSSSKPPLPNKPIPKVDSTVFFRMANPELFMDIKSSRTWYLVGFIWVAFGSYYFYLSNQEVKEQEEEDAMESLENRRHRSPPPSNYGPQRPAR